MSTEPTLRRVPLGSERDAYLPLFHLADDSADQMLGYYQTGTLFALDEPDGTPVGLVLAIDEPDGSVELKAVAVDEARQGQGVGTRLLLAVLEELRARHVRRVVVGTSSSGIGQLAYYQKAGFRLARIERDYFTPDPATPRSSVENGIPVRDMVWMDRGSPNCRTSSARRAQHRHEQLTDAELYLRGADTLVRVVGAVRAGSDGWCRGARAGSRDCGLPQRA